MKRTMVQVALVIGFGAVVVTDAQAQSNCQTYGYLALKQARENEQRKCGGVGPRWTTNLNDHIAWCNSVGPNAWREELRERAKFLEQCRK